MKTCKGCKYADWRKTKAGKLHPTGDGKCAYEYKVPQLPAPRGVACYTDLGWRSMAL